MQRWSLKKKKDHSYKKNVLLAKQVGILFLLSKQQSNLFDCTKKMKTVYDLLLYRSVTFLWDTLLTALFCLTGDIDVFFFF